MILLLGSTAFGSVGIVPSVGALVVVVLRSVGITASVGAFCVVTLGWAGIAPSVGALVVVAVDSLDLVVASVNLVMASVAISVGFSVVTTILGFRRLVLLDQPPQPVKGEKHAYENTV